MKQVISYNEEYNDLALVKTLSEEKNQVEAFHNYMVERTMELLDIDQAEAEMLIENSDEEAHYNIVKGDGFGRILFGGEFAEHIAMIDVPESDEAREKIEDLQRKNEILMALVESAIGELREGAEEWYAENIYDAIGTSEEELKSLGFKIMP